MKRSSWCPAGRRTAGFTLFELLVVCVVIGLLATLALNRLWALQQNVEQVMAEQVIGALKNGLRIRAAELMSSSRWEEFRTLPQHNPFDLLEEVPSNYRGELRGSGEEGCWYFERATNSVVYYVKRADDFQAADGSKIMRFNVVGVDANGRPVSQRPSLWIGLKPQSEYVWLGRILR